MNNKLNNRVLTLLFISFVFLNKGPLPFERNDYPNFNLMLRNELMKLKKTIFGGQNVEIVIARLKVKDTMQNFTSVNDRVVLIIN
jgi:hypothetical protein